MNETDPATPSPTTNSKSYVIGFCILVIASGVSFWFGYGADSYSRPNEGLVVGSDSLDFGEVWEDDKFSWVLPVKNPSNTEIEITRFEQSCTCAITEPSMLVIPAQSTAQVRVLLNLTPGTLEQMQRPYRQAAIQISPIIKNSVVHQPGWTIQGRVKSAFFLSALDVAYDKTLTRGEPFPAKKLIIHGHLPLDKVEGHCTPPLAQLRIESISADRKTFQVELTPKPDWPAGFFSAKVLVHAVVDGKRAGAARSFRLSGEISEKVVLDTPAVFLGPKTVGDVFETTVRLRSLVRQPFIVANIENSSGDIQSEAATTETNSYRVRLQIRQPGYQERRVVFHVAMGSAHDEMLTIPFAVSYHGVSPGGE